MESVVGIAVGLVVNGWMLSRVYCRICDRGNGRRIKGNEVNEKKVHAEEEEDGIDESEEVWMVGNALDDEDLGITNKAKDPQQHNVRRKPRRQQQQQRVDRVVNTKVAGSASDPDPFNLGEVYKFRSLGRLRSVFSSKRGVPRQGLLVPSVRAYVQIESHVSRDSVEGLDQFSHVWLVFLFSRNTNARSSLEWIEQGQSFQSRVTPPVLGGKKEGVFATRSPHRPNPIGLTLAVVEKIDIENRRVYVRGIDICDGTPILDIKPYHPSDRPPVEGEIRYPQWIEEATKNQMQNENSRIFLKVVFAGEADDRLADLCKDHPNPFYGDDISMLKQAVTEVLRLDVRAIHQNRGSVEPDVAHFINMAGYRFCMYFDAPGQVTVRGVEISPLGNSDLDDD